MTCVGMDIGKSVSNGGGTGSERVCVVRVVSPVP